MHPSYGLAVHVGFLACEMRGPSPGPWLEMLQEHAARAHTRAWKWGAGNGRDRRGLKTYRGKQAAWSKHF